MGFCYPRRNLRLRDGHAAHVSRGCVLQPRWGAARLQLRLAFVPLLFFVVSCGSNECGECDQTYDRPLPVLTAAAITIRQAPASPPIVIDGNLDDWDPRLVVFEVRSDDNAQDLQWRCVRDRCFRRLSSQDIRVTVYLAWRNDALYVAFSVLDDIVRASPSSEHAYSGDCFELFVAAAALDSTSDFQAHVAIPAHEAQAAFFQLDIPPLPLSTLGAYFPDYRTDQTFKRTMIDRPKGFSVKSSCTGSACSGPTWSAEARIPFEGFERDLAAAILDGKPFKIGITFLDYDERLADPSSRASNFGFDPDNVFSPVTEEDAVNKPAYMRTAVLLKD